MKRHTRWPVLLLLGAACTTAPTDPSGEAADVVLGSVHDLVRVDGQPPPWVLSTMGRFEPSSITVFSASLTFGSSLGAQSYEFRLYREADPRGITVGGGYKQQHDGRVEFITLGTTDGGSQVTVVEASGRPERGRLPLATTGSFWYGAHLWTFHRRD